MAPISDGANATGLSVQTPQGWLPLLYQIPSPPEGASRCEIKTPVNLFGELEEMFYSGSIAHRPSPLCQHRVRQIGLEDLLSQRARVEP